MSAKKSELDWREGRRRRAWELKQQGWKQTAIAAALGVTPGAVSQWLKRARVQGVDALRRHPAPGPPPKLTAAQRAQIPAVLERGAEAYGFRGQVWTCKRVAEVIRRTFGVTYHPAHVNRLLHARAPQRPTSGRASHPARRGGDRKPGGRSAGLRLKKSHRRGTHDRLGRPVRLLPVAHGGPHVGAPRATRRSCACR